MCRTEQVELWLTQQGVDYEYLPFVELGDIDFEASLNRQTRLERKLEKDRCEEIADAMRNEVPVNALIGHKVGNKYVLDDGLHRYDGLVLAGLEGIDIYRINTQDEAILDFIAAFANRLGGKGTRREDGYIEAIYWIEKHNRSISEAAWRYQINADELSRRLVLRRIQQRVDRLGGKSDAYTPAHLRELSPIQLDKPLIAVEKFVREHRLNAAETRELRIEVTVQTDEQSQLAVVDRWYERPDMKQRYFEFKPPKLPRFPYRGSFFRLTTSLANLLNKYPTWLQLQISSADDRKKAYDCIRTLQHQFERLLLNVNETESKFNAKRVSK